MRFSNEGNKELFAAQNPVEESCEPASQGHGNTEPFRNRVTRFKMGVGAEIPVECQIACFSGLQYPVS